MSSSDSKFKNKIKKHIPYLRRFAYAIVDDREHADKLVQHCVMSAVAQQEKYNSDNSLRAWLYSMLHNVYATDVSQNRLHNLNSMDKSAAEKKKHNSLLIAALQNLPFEYKIVFILITLEEMTYQETASILDITVGSVISRLCTARRRLQIILDAP